MAITNKLGFWGTINSLYEVVGTSAQALSHLASAAVNVAKVADIKSNVYLQETTLEDEARLEELKLRLAHRLELARANPAALPAPEVAE